MLRAYQIDVPVSESSGVKVLKLHPHTQQFDASNPRVPTMAQQAGALGVSC